MIRHLIALVFLFSVAPLLQAQDSTAYVQDKPTEKPIPFKDRLWFGGGIGLSFGTITAVQLDPVVGIYLDRPRKVSAGLGPSYTYYQDNRYSPPFELSSYGYRVFTRYRVIEQAFLHAEFLHMNTESYYNFNNDLGRIWVPHLLVGAGYVQPISSSSSFYLQVLFEVLQDPNSIYYATGPIFSAGVGIGF
ncbi:MAG: hypothetical protein K8H89_04300 [Flavobacteriales bacterium]|jgi:hypothetical protein|nr:hypothetical protein [Flavobacteriales bacterium]MCB0758638.1 hypothetical protein [Flavobacteriales bacterium]